VQEDDVLVAGQPSCRDGAGALLQRDLLVVAVDGLLHVHGEGALGLALGARPGLDLGRRVLHRSIERVKKNPAFIGRGLLDWHLGQDPRLILEAVFCRGHSHLAETK
jgi:hypothetical protein